MIIGCILVIDDCDLSQMVAQMEIEQLSADIQILEAFDGLEALQLLRGLPSPPDLVLLDINMPRMNGHEFLAAYASEFTEHCKVAMISSSGLPSDRDACARYPFVHHYFVKPFNRTHIDEVLKRVEAETMPQPMTEPMPPLA